MGERLGTKRHASAGATPHDEADAPTIARPGNRHFVPAPCAASDELPGPPAPGLRAAHRPLRSAPLPCTGKDVRIEMPVPRARCATRRAVQRTAFT